MRNVERCAIGPPIQGLILDLGDVLADEVPRPGEEISTQLVPLVDPDDADTGKLMVRQFLRAARCRFGTAIGIWTSNLPPTVHEFVSNYGFADCLPSDHWRQKTLDLADSARAVMRTLDLLSTKVCFVDDSLNAIAAAAVARCGQVIMVSQRPLADIEADAVSLLARHRELLNDAQYERTWAALEELQIVRSVARIDVGSSRL